jgi:PAS domain S-box-containing protein
MPDDKLPRRIDKAVESSTSVPPDSAGRFGPDGQALAELLNGILGKMKLGIALTDGNANFLGANSAFCDFLGYSNEELVTKSVFDVTVPEEMPGEVRTIREGESDSQRFVKRYIAKDGRILPARLTCNVLRNASGEVEFALGIVEDLSRQATKPGNQEPAAAVSPAAGDDDSRAMMQRGPRLTPREEQVFKLLIEGWSLKQIATQGKVSLQSVWKHQQRILEKFAVENEVELVRLLLSRPGGDGRAEKPDR